ERLDDDRSELVAMCRKRLLGLLDRESQRFRRRATLAPAKDVRWVDLNAGLYDAAKEAVEGVAVADGHRTERVAVIAFGQREKAIPSPFTAQVPVLQRHL